MLVIEQLNNEYQDIIERLDKLEFQIMLQTKIVEDVFDSLCKLKLYTEIEDNDE
jgi:hypothetical protein